MASGSLRFYSHALRSLTNVTFVLPNDLQEEMVAENPHYQRPPKTLYLLHGFTGNEKDWLYGGLAEDLATQYNLSIFMYTTGNNFYLDREATGCQYGKYAGEEVIAYTRKTFGLSHKREDTLIGGYSMGGFGALHTSLAYPETFSACIALSSALIIHEIAQMKPGDDNEVANYAYYREVFGDLASVESRDTNPEVLLRNAKEKGLPLPSLYLAIGKQDFLYEKNQDFLRFLRKEKVDFLYEEDDGIHDWNFWRRFIHRGIEAVLQDESVLTKSE
ncbi:MAG: acetylesterase [Blautia sp.]|nr:acetylesterase [Blautia sp.]